MLQMIEKGQNEAALDVRKLNGRGRFTDALLGKVQEQRYGVAFIALTHPFGNERGR